jgi:hypothetical protein
MKRLKAIVKTIIERHKRNMKLETKIILDDDR